MSKSKAYKDQELYTRGNATPKEGRKRGCLCKDGTYSRECCGGDALMAQGI